MKSFSIGGITLRIACGTITYRIALRVAHPQGPRGLHLAGGPLEPGAVDLGVVGAVRERDRDHPVPEDVRLAEEVGQA